MNGALKPEFFGNLPTFVKDNEAQKKGVSQEERYLYSMSQGNGWKILSDYIESLLKDLNQLTETSMAQGLTFEEIGRNAIVASLAKGIIQKVKNKVEDAREVVEKPDGTTE